MHAISVNFANACTLLVLSPDKEEGLGSGRASSHLEFCHLEEEEEEEDIVCITLLVVGTK